MDTTDAPCRDMTPSGRACDRLSGSRIVKTENTRNAVLVGLHPPFRRARPLKWRTGSAILKSLVREHRAHTAFMSAGHPAMHEVQFPGTGVALVTRP